MEPEEFPKILVELESEIGKVIVGLEDVVRKVLIAFFAGGHVLLEGVPGLGKTLLINTMSRALGLSFKRVQFTPDLMPSDVTGTQVLTEIDGRRDFQFKKGPIFAQVVLADEINRATPKTQSAVLEAMEERQVTVFGETFPLDTPFMVLATQNPIELEGTYPLPEAQLDRFFFKLWVPSPSSDQLREILHRTTGLEMEGTIPVIAEGGQGTMEAMMGLLRQVLIAPPLEDYVVRLIQATQPGAQRETDSIPEVGKYLRFGASPRGAQAIVLGAKGNALTEGRVHVAYEDIETMVIPALRHRLVLNFQAEADNVGAEQILAALMKKIPRD